jgi:hypothetical protein
MNARLDARIVVRDNEARIRRLAGAFGCLGGCAVAWNVNRVAHLQPMLGAPSGIASGGGAPASQEKVRRPAIKENPRHGHPGDGFQRALVGGAFSYEIDFT